MADDDSGGHRSGEELGPEAEPPVGGGEPGVPSHEESAARGSVASQEEQEHDRQVDSDEQPFLSHIIELRRRILRSLSAVALLFVPMYYFIDEIFAFISGPLQEKLPGDMIATQVASPFLTPFKLAIYAAIFAAVPLLLHQMWGFVSPGLYLREKRFAAPLLFSSIVLFYLGMAFAYFLVFPLVFEFFASVTPEGVAMMTDINHYLDFVLKMFLAFGLAFEIPVATVLLVLSGLATPQGIASKRPYVIVGCFFVGMLLTPPDIISQVLLAIPAWVLFEVGIALSRMIKPQE
ncbi:MAG: twin-arginine translocase subunit TatC [Gammaproteobacteria bacterium]|nr:twin-arginine translocase subunit TatC [Gammaproteobacteria bacterium]